MITKDYKTLTVTKEMIEQMEKWLGKPYDNFTDVDAITMVEEFVNPTKEVEDATFDDDETIRYTLKEEEEESEDVRPGWTEEYLNSLGMSKKDFC